MINNFYKNVLDSLDSYIVVVQNDGQVAFSNKQWDLLLLRLANVNTCPHFSNDFYMQTKLLHLASNISISFLRNKIEQLFSGKNESFVIEAANSLKDVDIWMEIEGVIVNDAEQQYVLLNYRNIIDKKIDQKKIDELTHLDPLTGLANKASFNDFFLNEWKRSIRSHSVLALFQAEINSHLLTSEDLNLVAKIFSQQARRASDCAGVLSSHRFALVLGALNSADCEAIAYNLHKQIADLNIYTQDGLQVSVNIGMSSTIPTLIDCPEMLFKASSLALEKAIESRQRVLCEQPSICLKEMSASQ